MADLITLDASVLIAYADRNDAHHARAVALLADENAELWVCSLNLAEFLVAPARAGLLGEALDLVFALDINEFGLSEGSAEDLARVRVETGLKMPDCCVIYAAEQLEGSAVAAFDTRLREAASGRGLAVLPGPAQ